MKIILTAHEASLKGLWGPICDLKNWNIYTLAEGIAENEYEIILSEEEAIKLGLLKEEV